MSQTTLSDLYMDLSKYVTFGEWRSDNQFNELLKRVYSLVSRPEHPMELYRTLRLNAAQQAEFHKSTLTFGAREFASWTKSLASAKILAQTKGDNCIILKQTFLPDQIVIDVDEFYSENGWDSRDFSEYHKYVKPEQEVIVYHQEPIRVTQDNTILPDHDVSVTPMLGDQVFRDEDDDEGFEIGDVDHEQDFANRGIYSVDDEAGNGPYWIRNIGEFNGRQQWEVVQEVTNITEGWHTTLPIATISGAINIEIFKNPTRADIAKIKEARMLIGINGDLYYWDINILHSEVEHLLNTLRPHLALFSSSGPLLWNELENYELEDDLYSAHLLHDYERVITNRNLLRLLGPHFTIIGYGSADEDVELTREWITSRIAK